MTIDAVAVPDANSSDAEEDQDDFDIELVFQKALLEADSEWKQSAQKKVIDTNKSKDITSVCPLHRQNRIIQIIDTNKKAAQTERTTGDTAWCTQSSLYQL